MPSLSTIIRGVLVSFIILGVAFLAGLQSGKGATLNASDQQYNPLSLLDLTPTATEPPQFLYYLPDVKNNYGVLYSSIVFANGQGFDNCKPLSVEGMRAWWDSSPYSTVNIYLGGISALCPFNKLDLSWFSQVAQQGWSFILTWAGPQAPKGCPADCKFRHPMSLDPYVAYLEGKIEALSAVEAAEKLGFEGQLVIYYDLESYSGADDEDRAAVAAFMRGWVEELHDLGHQAGAYGAACTSYIVDWAFNSPPPDNIWIAHWSKNYAYDPNASVWDTPCVDDHIGPPIFWTNHQRIKQYTGPHDEAWGGLTVKIDSNVLDGKVVALYGQPPEKNMQTLSPVPTTSTLVENKGEAVRDMHLLSPRSGWVLRGEQLLWTEDGGASWQDLSPQHTDSAHLLGVSFLDNKSGWALNLDNNTEGIGPLSILRTVDGGKSWQKSSVLIENPEAILEIDSATLDFVDPLTGWISIKLLSSSNFSFGRLFTTQDGGTTWQERELPIGGSVNFKDAQQGWIVGGPLNQIYYTENGGESWRLTNNPSKDEITSVLAGDVPRLAGELPSGAVAVSQFDDLDAWTLVHNGSCSGYKPRPGESIPQGENPLQCKASYQLLQTTNGGITWGEITP